MKDRVEAGSDEGSAARMQRSAARSARANNGARANNDDAATYAAASVESVESASQPVGLSSHDAATELPADRPARPRIGIHAPIAGGLHKALLKSGELGCDAVQIFSRNPRGWRARPLTGEEIERFGAARAATGITPVVIHCNYLVNLAAANPDILEKSRASFREEVLRGVALGADYLVVHPGSARGSCEADAIRVCAESIKTACDGVDLGAFRILLENTAGQGECIGHRFEHLGQIMADCQALDLGVCFDTAHAFTAGYDLREREGLNATIESLERNVGSENVRAVHFNDSKADYNSRVDRHWHIGQGHIGTEALRRIARHPVLAHAAFLLETPQDETGDDARNLSALRRFIEDR
ncbi:MAG TPA: deoxyribonuclease IV [Pyrinomonadaceae bacterium]|nr:deoxyribonuclease IV [Pyrinomonadaceae bacterium]